MSKRLKFFLYHSAISVVIALAVIGLVFLNWYPFPLAKALGVTNIFLMLIIIDVILGPFLAWLVYKEGKKTLKMDLSIIIFIQIAALMYGVYSIAEARPVWIVFNDKAFEFVASSGNEEPEDLAAALERIDEQATSLIEEMRLHGDIASEDDGEEESEETSNDESEDFDADSDDDFDADLSDFPEKVIEALAFVGDVIQDTSEKICDALDESVERIQEHDFDF